VDRARGRRRRAVGRVVGLVEAGAAGVAGREGDGDVVVDVGARRIVSRGGGGGVVVGGGGGAGLGGGGSGRGEVLDDLAVAAQGGLARRVIDRARRRRRRAVGGVVGLVDPGAAGVAGREGDGDVVVDVGARRIVSRCRGDGVLEGGGVGAG